MHWRAPNVLYSKMHTHTLTSGMPYIHSYMQENIHVPTKNIKKLGYSFWERWKVKTLAEKKMSACTNTKTCIKHTHTYIQIHQHIVKCFVLWQIQIHTNHSHTYSENGGTVACLATPIKGILLTQNSHEHMQTDRDANTSMPLPYRHSHRHWHNLFRSESQY